MYTASQLLPFARDILERFLAKIEFGSCNLPHLLDKHLLDKYSAEEIIDIKLPSWAIEGKDLVTQHYKEWLEKQEACSYNTDLSLTEAAYQHTEKLKTGNCVSLSLGYVHKLQKLMPRHFARPFHIEILAGADQKDIDHVFVLLNRPQYTSFQNCRTWSPEWIIVDPWIRQIYTADKWLMMTQLVAPCVGWKNPTCPKGFTQLYDNFGLSMRCTIS